MNMLDKLTALTGITKTSFKYSGKKITKFAESFCNFSKVNTVMVGKGRKMGYYGVTCIFVGYTLDLDGDCYHMYGHNTGKIARHDTLWLT